MVIAALAVVTLVGAAAVSRSEQPEIQVFFSRVDQPRDAISQALGGASATVHIAMYYFTDRGLADAIIRARQRGVLVYVYLDRSQVQQQYSQARYLVAGGVPVRISSNRAIMHNKFAVVDGSTVLTGSYNWTAAADQKNDENLVVIHRADIAVRYKQRFAGFWTNEWDATATGALRSN